MRTSIWAIYLCLWGSSVLSHGLPKCPESYGVELQEETRSLIYKEICERVSIAPEYSCDMEKSAASLVLKDESRDSEDSENVEMIYSGKWRPTFISDAIEWWTEDLKKLEPLKRIGCFHREYTGAGIKKAKMSCIFHCSGK
ncbi:hypothetical protein ANCCAN_01361 [Ancylostoma caninum]|uniref:SCP domain-containing protein n=1 Tax=Ancylostoma caninum TaxID=29170 RepID=A0A368H9L6_ANCCA|nr:hypothetical protein ANCCAN_01361 [Ancylostoma caninum]